MDKIWQFSLKDRKDDNNAIPTRFPETHHTVLLPGSSKPQKCHRVTRLDNLLSPARYLCCSRDAEFSGGLGFGSQFKMSCRSKSTLPCARPWLLLRPFSKVLYIGHDTGVPPPGTNWTGGEIQVKHPLTLPFQLTGTIQKRTRFPGLATEILRGFVLFTAFSSRKQTGVRTES